MAGFNLDISRTALLVMDFQTSIVERFAQGQTALIENLAALISLARQKNLPVIYVICAFRPGFPEVSPNNRVFSAVKAAGGWLTDIHPRLAPLATEPVVVKRRTGAFFGTDLEVILRSSGVDTLILCGINTSGVVLSTVRHAADADYRLVVVGDCCWDGDETTHVFLLSKIFPRQADVIQAADLTHMLLQGS